MTKSRYAHIKRFSDFKQEKVRLYYEIKLTENKLKLKQLEFKEALNPIRFISSILQEIWRPLLEYFKSFLVGHFRKKTASNEQNVENKKSSDS